jgi:Cu(I)/Ag(I) efflux system membrane fusion protein
MKLFNKKYLNVATYILITVFVATGAATSCQKKSTDKVSKVETAQIPDYYTCPMHSQIHSDKPGQCPICGMTLVPVYREKESGGENLQKNAVKNSTDEDEDSVVVEGVRISTERQQLIGVKRAKVTRQKIRKELRTTGRVAFDPELALAVREYMNTPGNEILRQAAYSRLRLLGMGEDEIHRLSQGQNAASYTSLYLPEKGGAVWVYATLYEGDMGKVKTGDGATIQLPDKNSPEFTGRVHSLAVTVDAATRTIRARIFVPGAGGKLLPDTYVNVSLYSEKGDAVMVPQSAIVDTGEKQMVFVIEDDNRFVPRAVHLGAESGDMVAILHGLSEGETVVSSAAFLIDSETQLKSPMSSPGHHHD